MNSRQRRTSGRSGVRTDARRQGSATSAPRRLDDDYSLPALGCLVLLGGVFPLAATPLATDPVMPVRMLVLGVALALGFLAQARAGLSRPLMIALGVALAVFVVAALAGPTPVLSLLGRYPRYEGLPMMLAYASALVLGARLLQRPRHQRIFVTFLSLATCVNAVVAVGQLVFEPSARITGLLGNSTTLGTYGLVALAVVGWSLASEQRPVLWAGTAAGAGLVVLSASRGVLVGVVAALGVALLVRRVGASRPRWQPLVIGTALVAVAALLVPQTAARITGASPFSSATITGRLLLWQESVQLWLQHPVLGVGPSGFVDAINRFHDTTWAATVGPYAPPDAPHDLVLQLACSTGALGLLAVAGVLYVAGRDALTLRAPMLGPAAVVAAGLAATYLTSFTDPVTMTLGAFVVGGALAARPYTRLPLPLPQRLVPAGVALAATGFLGGTLLVAEAAYSGALTAADPGPSARAAIAARPWDVDLVRRVAYTASKRAEAGAGDIGYLVAPLTAACARVPDSVECQLTLSAVRDAAQDSVGALAAAQSALAIDPTTVDGHLAAGIAWAKLGRYDDAEAAFRRASTLRPTAPEPWSDLASLYDLMGRTSDAAAARTKAAELTKR